MYMPHQCPCHLSRQVNPFKSYNTQEPQAAFLHQSTLVPQIPFLSMDSVWPPSRRFHLHHVASTRVHTLPRVDLQGHACTTPSLSQHPSRLKALVGELRSGAKLCLGNVVKSLISPSTSIGFCLPELQSYATCDSGLGASTAPPAEMVHPRYAHQSL
ncbi:hypothetical protein BKA70DRAFT_1299121 [Coprinopsis sp. MPI-PUGE-AT-0042]|nr:hypothetical protein BKA70DRAFT_1299121 [Coprinopsis sp. MPI-PUGE-AT-0042]